MTFPGFKTSTDPNQKRVEKSQTCPGGDTKFTEKNGEENCKNKGKLGNTINCQRKRRNAQS